MLYEVITIRDRERAVGPHGRLEPVRLVAGPFREVRDARLVRVAGAFEQRAMHLPDVLEAGDVEHALVVIRHVITSYSIHYTKLYD